MKNSFVVEQSIKNVCAEIDNLKEKLKLLGIDPRDYYKVIDSLTVVRLHLDSMR
ncbi:MULTISPECIES: hypothetical protein [Bacillus cereus group]|uniref:hypothetical protein n=1 Tax=Bacillus cereus group TaxID=86661 RepID=UPI00159B87C4|nr:MULTISPECIES: hypothetical protein [Bacillus cereus group]MCU5109811.1 hypothetical protein [Bacillus cereus]MED2684048.1 hypothetical protein [Bacillus thuringiensis]MCP9282331.1 hypothetical protein [Bacillus wiedmannii]MDA1553316.1 hypothetical protein [Bacillus cereus group sp. TH243-3LC]MDA1861371.1 hypothetical protein [Bacillus cereus group sp. BY122LC]